MSTASVIAARPRSGTRRSPPVPAERRDAALLSIGTLASGVLAYAFNVLAARSLGPEAYGAVGALWGGMFLLAVLLFRPLEQTVTRAVADHVARGADARPAVRSAAKLAALVMAAATGACVAAWTPLTAGLFGGQAIFTVALVVGLLGYGLSYFARGLLGGVRWFGGYGLLLLADGGIRMALALPLLLVASPAIAAVAIAAAAAGGAVAPLLSSGRAALRRIAGEGRGDYRVGAAARFAAPAAVIAGCEQVLVSGGPLLVLIAGGPRAQAAAGVLFAATLLVRAPVFLFQGIQASLLASLTTFEAGGDSRRAHRATVRTAGVLAAFAGVLAAAALAAGPAAMTLLYGDGFGAGRADLALLAVGIGAFLTAGTFSQALLAVGRAGRAALGWTAGAASFVALELALGGTTFHRVSVAFAAGTALAAALLVVTVWRSRP